MNESISRPSPEHEPSADGGQPINPEIDREVEPRIYVASLTDYNHGVLHGAWIDADRDVEVIYDKTQAMLATSPTARRFGERAEEWAIHDHEGFGPLPIGEHDDLHLVARLARGMGDHGTAFGHWAGHVGKADADLMEFEEYYLGEWKSVEDYAEHVLDDLGYIADIEKAVPEYLRPYVKIDTAGFARDLELSGDVWSAEADGGGVHLFDARG